MAAPERAVTPATDTHMAAERVTALYHGRPAIADVSLPLARRAITAVIGPSGCGKSTFLRCLNRMHELSDGGTVRGRVLLDDVDIYGPGVDAVGVRRRVGMVFQRATTFPTMSIAGNVAAGLRVNGVPRREVDGIVERALRQAALWDEVRDRLHGNAMALSGGQQQRLCIARALATEPEVLLMDEPCSALDPIATLRIEELMQQLKETYTIVIVTHNMQQAARISDYTAYMYLGDLIELGDTSSVFTNPKRKETEDYITGRFG